MTESLTHSAYGKQYVTTGEPSVRFVGRGYSLDYPASRYIEPEPPKPKPKPPHVRDIPIQPGLQAFGEAYHWFLLVDRTPYEQYEQEPGICFYCPNKAIELPEEYPGVPVLWQDWARPGDRQRCKIHEITASADGHRYWDRISNGWDTISAEDAAALDSQEDMYKDALLRIVRYYPGEHSFAKNTALEALA